jgi:hypothetical protein
MKTFQWLSSFSAFTSSTVSPPELDRLPARGKRRAGWRETCDGRFPSDDHPNFSQVVRVDYAGQVQTKAQECDRHNVGRKYLILDISADVLCRTQECACAASGTGLILRGAKATVRHIITKKQW